MKYPKPKQLSDPFSDWQGCEDQLRAILQKDDVELNADDFNVIYYSCLPAANYEEGAYYIEKCTDYIATGWDIRDSRLPSGLLRWIVTYGEELAADRLFDDAKGLIVSSLWRLLDRFDLFDLTKEECARLGMDFSYAIGPYNRETVGDFMDELTIYDEFEPELNGIVDRLIESDELSHIRWYIEIAAHTRTWSLLYNEEHSEPDERRRKEALLHRLHAFPVYHRKGWAAMKAAQQEDKQKYVERVLLWR